MTRSVDELDAAIGRLVSPDERRLVSHARARARVRRSVRLEEVVVQELCGVGRVALRYLACRRRARRCAPRTRCVRCPRSRRHSSEGRLSYSKVRALTRVAQIHDEDLLLAYALDATVQRVEERCRQIRNVAPDSVHHARRAWENRSLTMWRDEGRGLMRFTVEVPIDEGELIVRALDCAVAGGEVTTDLDPDAIAEAKGTAWRAQQADALVAVAKSYLDGGQAPEGGATADHYQVVVHADAKSLTGGTGRADLPIETVKRLLCDCSLVTVVEDEKCQSARRRAQAAHRIDAAQARAARARSRLHVPGLSSQALCRRASSKALDQRRRDDSRQHDAAVHASPQEAARRRLQHREGSRRHAAIRDRRRPHDPALRLSARGLRR